MTICARTLGPLEATAEEIRALDGGAVTAIACDITTDEGRDKILEQCSNPDILINNAGGPPPVDFRDWDRDAWIKAIDANILTPIFLIKATVDGMMERKFGRVINITSSAVKAPNQLLGLSNGARAGLTGFIAGIARKTVANNVTINAVLPGAFDTDRLRSNFKYVAEKTGKSVDEVATARAAENPAKRLGQAYVFGALCAFLCSDQAGFITGQNILIDGGNYPGTL